MLLGDAGEAIDPRKNKTKSEAGQSEAGQEGKDESDEFQLPDEMPEDATFVPLWIPKESPPYSYKGSDPEWQGYLAFANDRKKAKQVYGKIGRDVEHLRGCANSSIRFGSRGVVSCSG